MQNLDNEEKRIHDAFSQIKVDSAQLEKRLKSVDKPSRMKRRLTVALVAVLIFVTVSATAYASVGGLDGIIARFNPEFGAFAMPLLEPAYTEDQGIKIEVVGARVFENVVLIYVTMEDVTGEERLTRHIRPDFEVYSDGERLSNGGGGSRRLNFDDVNNRAYFEMSIIVDSDAVWDYDALEVRAEYLNCFEFSGPVRRAFEGDWRLGIRIDYAEDKTIVWTDITVDDMHIEYMALGVMGLRIMGTHSWTEEQWMHAANPPLCLRSATVEVENRIRNIRFLSSGSGIGPDHFDIFYTARSPIDMDAVTGVVVNGVHIPLP